MGVALAPNGTGRYKCKAYSWHTYGPSPASLIRSRRGLPPRGAGFGDPEALGRRPRPRPGFPDRLEGFGRRGARSRTAGLGIARSSFANARSSLLGPGIQAPAERCSAASPGEPLGRRGGHLVLFHLPRDRPQAEELPPSGVEPDEPTASGPRVPTSARSAPDGGDHLRKYRLADRARVQFRQAVEWLQRCLDFSAQARVGEDTSEAQGVLAAVYYELGDFDRAWVMARQAHEAPQKAGNELDLASASLTRGKLHAAKGDREQARQLRRTRPLDTSGSDTSSALLEFDASCQPTRHKRLNVQNVPGNFPGLFDGRGNRGPFVQGLHSESLPGWTVLEVMIAGDSKIAAEKA